MVTSFNTSKDEVFSKKKNPKLTKFNILWYGLFDSHLWEVRRELNLPNILFSHQLLPYKIMKMSFLWLLVDACYFQKFEISRLKKIYLVSSNTLSWERHYDSTKFVSNSANNFSTSGHEIFMMLGIYSHNFFNNFVQILDTGFQFDFSRSHGFLRTQNGDDFTIFIFFAWENDSCSSLIANALNIYTIASNQKFVMFWFSPEKT